MRKKIYSKYISNNSEIKFKQLLNEWFGVEYEIIEAVDDGNS